MNPRSLILDVLHGHRRTPIPAFSVLSNITAFALEARGLRFSDVHTDAAKMARGARSACELYGLPSIVLPADLCVEAEALGADIDFRADMPEPMWPLVAQPLYSTVAAVKVPPSGQIVERGRIPVVIDALRQIAASPIRERAILGAFVPGPFTLAVQVIAYDALLSAVKVAPHEVAGALDRFTDVLIPVAQAYRTAGADLITIHEMGGSPGVIGPRAFAELVLPRLRRLMDALPAPRVLSVCGNTNGAMELLKASGADALSVDEKNDLAHSRQVVGTDTILLGNLDPVRVLGRGTVDQVKLAVRDAVSAGADAVCPGCDMALQTPPENIRAWLETST